MADLAPGIHHQDDFEQSGPILGEDSSITAFMGRADRGPLNDPQRLVSFTQFLKIFGGKTTDSDLAYVVESFFNSGGQICYVNRLAHYTDVDAGTTNAAASTLDLDDPTADVILTVDAKSPGLYGDEIEVEVVANPTTSTTLANSPSAGANTFDVVSPKGLYVGQVLELDDGVNTEYVKVLSFETVVTAGTPAHTVTIEGVLINAFVATDDVTSVEFDLNVYFEDSIDPVEEWEQLSLESGTENNILVLINDEGSGSDYIEVTVDATNTLLLAGLPNDTGTYYPAALARTNLAGGVSVGTIDAGDIVGSELSGIGYSALDGESDIRIVAVAPDSDGGSYTAGAIHGGLSYCEDRGDCIFIAETDPADTASEAITAREANGYNSSFGALYFNRVQVFDTQGVGSDPSRFISPLGYVAGAMARADLREGPWQAAAGTAPYGNMPGARKAEQKVSAALTRQLNNSGINLVRNFNTGPLIFGTRSLVPSTDLQFRFLTVRRTLIFIQQSVEVGIRFAVFRPNALALWLEVQNKINEFLATVWSAGGLEGATADEAFEVLVGEKDGVQTPGDTLSGRLRAQAALSFVRPSERILIKWSELTA